MKVKVLFILTAFILSPSFVKLEASPCKEPLIVHEKPDLLLYYLPWCPYCRQVIDYLDRIGKTVPMENLQRNEEGREHLQKIGGKMQVPCLIVNDCALYDSAAIIRWFSENRQLLDSN